MPSNERLLDAMSNPLWSARDAALTSLENGGMPSADVLDAIDRALAAQPPPAVPPDDSGWGRNLAAAGALGLSALPFTRLARGMFASAPRAIASGAGLGGGGALLMDAAEAQTPPAEEDGLTATQRTRRAALTRKQEQLSRGRNPRELPEGELTELEGLNELAASFQKRRNELALEREGALGREQLEAEQRQRRQNTPIREAIPGGHWVLPAVAGALGGGLLGRGIARNATRSFNDELTELSTRWQGAVARAQAAKPNTNAHRLAVEEVSGIARRFKALQDAGAGGHPVVAGIGAGELSMNLPAIVDYTTGGGELRKKTLEEVISPTGLGRVALGAVAAGVPAKAMAALQYSRTARPPNYQAETDALVAALRRRGSAAQGRRKRRS